MMLPPPDPRTLVLDLAPDTDRRTTLRWELAQHSFRLGTITAREYEQRIYGAKVQP